MPFEKFLQKMGGSLSRFTFPKPAPVTSEVKRQALELPESFDWRNVSGVNYVSPVRNQEQCGSCFAFASAASLEARIRIQTNNEQQPIFSPQDVISCSYYAQGCAGGFPYLIAGKYAQDFGMVEEKYNPYQGIDTHCTTPANAPRHYTATYEYTGGYYGASNEENMMLSLVNNGPIVIGFMVFPDFYSYSGGVYQHTGLSSRFNPFYVINHAVLVVGYGTEEETGLKYWIVKNSWGENWGLDGYFLIRRGTNECGVETLAVDAHPIV
ncbi:dipeptidyl peptidase 1-like [Hetaerina americana]|uniref:dipeptidyl peptidase 1-like n=1 Tax=Hetaerina americana TaxID=62018 RepID=UPI003A7F2DE8